MVWAKMVNLKFVVFQLMQCVYQAVVVQGPENITDSFLRNLNFGSHLRALLPLRMYLSSSLSISSISWILSVFVSMIITNLYMYKLLHQKEQIYVTLKVVNS